VGEDPFTCQLFVTYELAQKAKLLGNIKLERLACDKHSSLLHLLIGYEENEGL